MYAKQKIRRHFEKIDQRVKKLNDMCSVLLRFVAKVRHSSRISRAILRLANQLEEYINLGPRVRKLESAVFK